MKPTKEWLQRAISDIETMRDEIPFGLDEDERNTLQALKLALAGMEAGKPDPQTLFKPVADTYKISHPDESASFCFSEKADAAINAIKNGYEVQEYVKLERLQEAFTAPQPLTTFERAELENYRKASAIEINDEMAFAFCRAISDDSVGTDEVEDIKTGLRAAFANVVASHQEAE